MKTFNEIMKIRDEPDNKPEVTKRKFQVKKTNNEKMQAFGWASVAIAENGETLERLAGRHHRALLELESAAYKFVDLYREGGEMHERGGVAYLIESVVFTEEKMAAMGIPEGTLPVGWWIGFQVTDADVWEKVKDGTYSMFSIEGEAERVEVNNE